MQSSKLLEPASITKRSCGPNSLAAQSSKAWRLEVFPAANFAGVVRGLAHEDRRGEGVRVAVQADDFSLGRRRRGQVGLDPKRLLWERVLSWLIFVMVFLRWPG